MMVEGSSSSSLTFGTLTSTEAPFGPEGIGDFISSAASSDSLSESYSSSTALVDSIMSLVNKMTSFDMDLNSSCQFNCSGRGECLNGTCFCSVQYEGESCHEPNIAYFASFSSIFFMIALISFGQLVLCIRAEYKRLKTPSLRKACTITTQKLLYFFTFVAAAIRGAYFSSPKNAELTLASSFFSSFYPIILSGGSLIVCFWAEAFHLNDIRCERPRFLGKSFLGFVIFNVITYSLFVVEVILQRHTTSNEERNFLTHVFNGCYAMLMFIMVVFFLIYGVEVYFKVRGGFVSDNIIVSRVHARRHSSKRHSSVVFSSASDDSSSSIPSSSSSVLHDDEDDGACDASDCQSDVDDESDDELSALKAVAGGDSELCLSSNNTSTTTLYSGGRQTSVYEEGARDSDNLRHHEDAEEDALTPFADDRSKSALLSQIQKGKKVKGGFSSCSSERSVDHSQLSQSRFGLVFQACMLMITVCFLFSDVLGSFWKNRVPLISRNAYDIVFRVVELGVALWFPCVLWNCIAPEQLWILNPRKILKVERPVPEEPPQDKKAPSKEDEVDVAAAQSSTSRECWICYETEASCPSAGPMIEPCLCRGDVAAVHHNCLRTWLMECAQKNNSGQLSCKVCQADYQLERSQQWWLGQGFTARHWLRTASLVTIMCGTIAGSWAMLQLFQDGWIRSITAGTMLLIIYICLRFLGFNTFSAYQRARFSAVKILGRHFSAGSSGTEDTSTEGVAERASSLEVPQVATITGGQVAVDITTPSV